MISIGLYGASGRMGQWVQKVVNSDYREKVKLLPAPSRKGPSENFPLDFLETNIQAGCVIDFSTPDGMTQLAMEMLNPSHQRLPPIVIGTTGFNQDQKKALWELSAISKVMISANFSLGIHTVFRILKGNTSLLESMGFVPTIKECHHSQKKDAPSGTALAVKSILKASSKLTTSGYQNVEIQSIRSGEVIGDHEITFSRSAEIIKISHHAQDRSLFAHGAIEAAIWLANKEENQGLFSFEDFFENRFVNG